MYKIVPWSKELDLSEFYKECVKKGFINNSSEKLLVECFRNEREWIVWILYYNNIPVGSVASHSFDDVMGPNTYRIAARTCVLSHKLPLNTLRTKNQIITHQNITSQFLIPKCIEWAPKNSRLFITSNENSDGTQRLVHRIFCPLIENTGQMKRIKDVFYRGTEQTVWELYPNKFLKELENNIRWTIQT